MSTRLPPLPALRDFIHMYKLQAKKILSQNYLMDMNITRKVVRHAKVKQNDYVIEIGPGPGGITRAILETDCKRLDVIEIDRRFIPPLEHLAEASCSRMRIHNEDVLKANLDELYEDESIGADWYDDCPPIHVIGNLPFNIASPLIIKYLRHMSKRESVWKFGRVPLTLTFQLEVANRICSPIACATRSRISIMSQYLTKPELVFKISGSCFVPRPQVDVGVVRFVPRKEPLIDCPFEVVEKVCRHVFHYRQKYVKKGLQTLYPKELAVELADEALRRTRIDPTTTSIRLGIEQFGDLSQIYYEQCKLHEGLFAYDYTKPHITLDKLSQTLPQRQQWEKRSAAAGSEGEAGAEWSLRDFSVS